MEKIKLSKHVVISKRVVFINSASAVITRLLSVTILVWVYQYIVRRVGPEEYSLLPVVMAIMAFLPLVTSILISGVSRFCIEAYARGDKQRVTQIVSSLAPILLAASMLFLLIMGAFAWNIDSIMNIPSGREMEARLMMLILVFGFSIRLPMMPFRCGFQIQQRFVFLNMVRLGMELLRIVLLFVFLFGISTRVIWIVAATAISRTAGMAAEVFISKQLIPELKFRLREFRLAIVKEVLNFGTWNFIGRFASQLRKASDPILLNLFAMPIDVTCFQLGNLFPRHIEEFSLYAHNPLQPSLIAMDATGQNDRLRNTFYRLNRYIIWAVLFISIPLIVYQKNFIDLYVGDLYMQASVVLGLLLLPFPITANQQLIWQLGNAVNKLRILSLSAIAIQIINIGFTIFLVKNLKMGAIGSALSTCIVMLVGQSLLMIPIGLRILEGNYRQWINRVFIPGIMPTFSGLLVWYGMREILKPSTWIMLILCVTVGCLVYILFLAWFCLEKQDREVLRAAYEKIKLITFFKKPA